MAKKKTKFIQYLTACDGSFGIMRQGDIIECDNKTAELLVEEGIAKIITEEDANNALNASVEHETNTRIPKAKLYARAAPIVVTQSAATQPAEEAEAPDVVEPQVRSDDDEYKDSYGEQ